MENATLMNVAFFDAEYTALSADDRGVQEMIQCAFVIHQIGFSEFNKPVMMTKEPLYVYATYVHPLYNKKLSDYIMSLTGIKQTETDNGRELNTVISDLYNLCEIYDVRRIITWGPDRVLLKSNCDLIDCDRDKEKKLIRKFRDVSKRFSDALGYDYTLSQHRVCELFKIGEIGARHDAFSDAINLSSIVRKFCGEFYHMAI